MTTTAVAVESRRWPLLAYGLALSLAAGLAYFLFRTPFQVSDNLWHLMIVQQTSFAEIWNSEASEGVAYFRPGLWWTIDAVFEAARGHYFVVFKAFHALQAAALLLLFARLLRVRTATDLAAAAFALVALVGMHTFVDNVSEGFPINTYMSILVVCLAAMNLAYGDSHWWRDVAAVAAFVYALFTVESGVLVLLILLAAYAVGFRGVRLRAIAACFAVLAFYVFLKFAVLEHTVPALDERSSGFGFTAYGQGELAEKFADDRVLFYLYNVVCAALTIFTAEPRAGVWRLTRHFAQATKPEPGLLIAVGTSTVSSALLVFFVWRERLWRRLRSLDHHERLVGVALAVIAGNAVMSFPYLKDVIVGPAGVFYVLALYAAVRWFLLWLETRPPGAVRALGAAALVAVSLGWSIRAAWVPYELRRYGDQYQQHWVELDEWIVEQGLEPTAEQRALGEELRDEALHMPVPPPPEPDARLDSFVDRR